MTNVAADTKTTTDAAKSVLAGYDFKDVQASSSQVDGRATAKKADGTEPAPTAKKPVKDATEAAAKEAVEEAVKETTAASVTAQETKAPAAETKEPAEKTNDSTKIEASTGS